MEKGQKALKALQDTLSQENASWEAGSNFMLELTAKEQQAYLGYTPGPDEPNMEEKEALSAQNFQSYLTAMSGNDGGFGAPGAYDLRNVNGANYITPVKNQGSCGSCVAFGTVAAVEGTERRAKNNPNLAVDYSEAHLFYCHARSEGRRCGGSNGGWWVPPALSHYQNTGVTDEACYPYTAGDQNCSGRCSDWASRVTKISGSTEITNINAMKDWISTKGPLIACYTVYSDFFGYRTGVYRKSAGATSRGGHCVCVVGYSDAQQAWICKNSWGTGWGDNGYFRIGYGQVGIDNKMWGINGIVDTGWLNSVKVTGLWVQQNNRNAWAYITGEGWKKISNRDENGFINLVAQLTTAKAGNRSCKLYINKGEITTAYVW
ncbi:peptidase C1 [Cryomorphaceae bacterium]|nr:peptidase C1 [Cryomorphaceae bacterium]